MRNWRTNLVVWLGMIVPGALLVNASFFSPSDGNYVYMHPQEQTYDPYEYNYMNKEELLALDRALDDRGRSEVYGFVGHVLRKLCDANDILQLGFHRRETSFHAVEAPPLGICEYIERIAKHVQYPSICFMISLAYIDRLAEESSDVHLYVNSLTAHRLLVASLLVAAKYIEEETSEDIALYTSTTRSIITQSGDGLHIGTSTVESIVDKRSMSFDDKYYEHVSKVAGMTVEELLKLEHDMLQALNQNAFVSGDEIRKYTKGILPDSDVPQELQRFNFLNAPYQAEIIPPPYQ